MHERAQGGDHSVIIEGRLVFPCIRLHRVGQPKSELRACDTLLLRDETHRVIFEVALKNICFGPVSLVHSRVCQSGIENAREFFGSNLATF